jgi:hypothetical protein
MPFDLTLCFDDDSAGPEAPVAAFVLSDTFGGTIGSRLATTISRRLRDEFAPAQGTPIFEGPHFVYTDNRRLFLGRVGRGPLRIALDTNMLIDYFQHGRALWEGAPLPELIPGTHGEELEGLQIVTAISVLRDIRFYVLQGTLGDAKRALDARRLGERLQALREFAGALSAVDRTSDGEPLPLALPDSVLHEALASVPAGNDRALVAESVRRRTHVFLTRDKAVLRAAPALRSFGLYIGTPLDLLEELTACGAVFCLTDPRYAYWPLSNQDRVAHLYHATLATAYTSGSMEIREIALDPGACWSRRDQLDGAAAQAGQT